MYQSQYFIDKTSNTFADNLAAFGLAYVLDGIANSRSKIRLEDRGYSFAVICEPGIKEEWVQNAHFFVGAAFLLTWDNKTQSKVVKGTELSQADLYEQGGATVVDYQVERDNRQAYFAWLSALPKEQRREAAIGGLDGPTRPHLDWEVFRAINPAILQGYNAMMAEWWRGRDIFPELLKALLLMTCQTPNDLSGAERAWKALCKKHGWKNRDVSALQLYNPTQGKGTNSSKAQWSSPGNLKSFWLLEWLKAVGLYHGGITRIVANPKDPYNAKDRKTYVLMPLRLEWGRHMNVMKNFNKAMTRSATAVKLDIFITLRYTKAFLSHYEAARAEDVSLALFNERPSDLVSGMQMAFYKYMGKAPATMNIASLNLPRWVAPRSPEDLAHFHEALDEHLAIINNLDESRGDQFELLRLYRDFLSANDLDPFFEFSTAYSGHIIVQRERGKYVRQFTTTTLEVLFMNSDDDRNTFSTILNDEGFRNIAYAIRHSTVIPQRMKGQGRKPATDIRYGLGQQLARKAAYPAEFLSELTEFLHLYNAENAQLQEKGRHPFRKSVTPTDIERITKLVDRFGSKVVCHMLVAYGYAVEPRQSREEKELPGEEEILPEPEGEYDDNGFEGE